MEKVKKTNDTDFEGEYLIFAQTTDGNYTIENKDFEMLGSLEKIRVGRFMQWCLFLENRHYLSPGCNDEVREMQKILGAKMRTNKLEQNESEVGK